MEYPIIYEMEGITTGKRFVGFAMYENVHEFIKKFREWYGSSASDDSDIKKFFAGEDVNIRYVLPDLNFDPVSFQQEFAIMQMLVNRSNARLLENEQKRNMVAESTNIFIANFPNGTSRVFNGVRAFLRFMQVPMTYAVRITKKMIDEGITLQSAKYPQLNGIQLKREAY